MAIPKMYNNSPSAGRIAWDSFVILYKNVPYFVPAGNTAAKWVWWKFNAGVPQIIGASSIPTLTDDDVLLFSNRDGISVRIQQTQLIDGELIVNGTIIGNAIKANEIQSTHIVTAGLDAGVIKFGLMNGDRISVNTLRGDRILANSIAVSKLTIASLDNIVEDPAFTQPLGPADGFIWAPTTTATGISIGVGLGREVDENAMVFVSNGVTKFVNGPFIPMGANRSFRVGFWVHSTSTISAGTAIMQLQSQRKNGTVTLSSNVSNPNSIPANTWTFVTGMVNSPTAPADVARARVMLGIGSSVPNGTTVKFDSHPTMTRANAGELIVDGTIIGAHIKGGEISGDKITATFLITSKTIKGGTVLGNTIQTSQTADTGPRMEINQDLEGGFIKGFTDPAGLSGVAPIKLNPRILGTGNARRQSFYMSSGSFGGGVASIDIVSGSVDDATPPRVVIDANMNVKRLTEFEANVKTLGTGDFMIDRYSSGGVTGANINNVGAIIRAGSSRKLKEEIEPLTLEEALKTVKMEAVSFKWRPEMEMGDARQSGFIAEQAAEVGADLWVTRDGLNEPSGIRYGELTAAHHVLINDLRARVEELEAR